MYRPRKDLSLLGILFGNVLSIVMAFIYGWDMGQIMWIYWGQSVAIGVMNFIRMLALKEFSTEGLKSNGSPVPETMAAKRGIAFFFLFHYGIFHAVYAGFLWEEMPLNEVAMGTAMLMMSCLAAFIGGHSFSYMHNLKADFRQKKPNLGTIMFYPYLRIIPMHLTIILGGATGLGMAIFMTLKTLADIGMHMVEHHLFQKPDSGAVRMED